MKGFIVYPTYRILEDKAYIYLFGRLENGESFLTINQYSPYFYIKKTDSKKAKELVKLEIEDTNLKNFDDEEVSKVILKLPKDVHEIKRLLAENKIVSYEADLKIESTEYIPTNLKVFSFDIETDMKGTKLFCISIYTDDYKKVLIASDKKDLKHAECFADEKGVLERFVQLVKELDPDIITGWNMIDFDLKLIFEKLKYYKIRPVFGRADWDSHLRIESAFQIDSKADFAGRQVLDGIQLVRTSFIKIENYKLDTAAQKFLGKEKLMHGDDRFKEIEESYKHDQQKLIDYNLVDSELVYEILYKAGLLDLTIQRSILTGMPLERVKASVASLDAVYLPRLEEKGYVAYSSNHDDDMERIKGGFVMESKPGIYEFILVLDFKSLYPSIIKTFNIDPLSFVAHPKNKEDLIVAPNGACFRNEDGILPQIISELWQQRDKAKTEKNKYASNAIKILMNSFFGVLANPTCRFHSLDVANAITHFGQYLIKLTAQKIKEEGYEVIYGDTDSVFVNSKAKDYDEAKKTGDHLAGHINKFFEKHIKDEYNRKSVMELEFEKVYKMFFMPTIRGTELGSKKRYAGLLQKDGEEVLDFVGLESVRSDWTEAAKKFQMKLFDLIFHKKEFDKFIKDYVKDLRAGKHDGDLVYRKGLTKAPSEYTKTTPPHVKAARLLGPNLTTNVIEYVQTINGPEPLQKLKSKIDYDHYIEKQIKPLADSILILFGKKFDDLCKGHSQKGLGDY